MQMRILLPLDQQVQRIQNRQPRLDQSQELLIENDKLALLDLPPPQLKLPSGKKAPWLDPVDQVTLLYETVANLRLRIAVLDLLQQVSAFVSCLYKKFSHALI